MSVLMSIQEDDFDIGVEHQRLKSAGNGVGAIVTFTGLVREFESDPKSADFQANLSTLTLEYYPEMTEQLLAEIIQQSFDRWPLVGVSVVHRVGSLKPNDQIVFVGVASEHRQEAFQAAQFLMDYLKTRATFWKKIEVDGESHWAEAKVSDNVAAAKWEGGNVEKC